MKKIISLIVLVFMLFTVSACEINLDNFLDNFTNIDSAQTNETDENKNQDTSSEESSGNSDENASEDSSTEGGEDGSITNPDDDGEVILPEYYGVEILKKRSNSENLLKVYEEYVNGISNFSPKIIFSVQISQDDFLLICDLLSRDHTDLFWFDGSISYTSNSKGEIIDVSVNYNKTKEEFTKSKEDFYKKCNEIVVGCKDLKTDYDKEKYIHDYLCMNVDYVLEAPNAHNAYGAIIEGKAVCEGYAEAFQYLLRLVGIQSFICIGTGDGGPHAWNYVKINGEFYFTDLTWDDQYNKKNYIIYYSYFNINEAVLTRDHIISTYINSTEYKEGVKSYKANDLPVCQSLKECYFTKNGGMFTKKVELTVENVVKAIDRKTFIGRFFCIEEVTIDDLKTFISNNYLLINTTVGKPLAGYSFGWLKNELLYTLT